MRMICILIALFFSPLSFSIDCYDKAGNDYQIDPDLLRAVAFRESSFQPNAIRYWINANSFAKL